MMARVQLVRYVAFWNAIGHLTVLLRPGSVIFRESPADVKTFGF